MIFLSLIVALALVQWWGSGAPVQRDGWFYTWMERLQTVDALGKVPGGYSFVAVLGPCLILALLIWGIQAWLSYMWVFFIAVPVLLYSLGRGDFTATVKAYLVAAKRGDSVAANRLLDEMRGDTLPVTEPDANNWQELNHQVLSAISYRGFERMFAVLFWFVFLGPVGALLYRLSVLYRERSPDRFIERWVWLLEWPVVRLMGLTWALAGNFDTCFQHWKQTTLDVTSASMPILRRQLLGALGERGAVDALEPELAEPASVADSNPVGEEAPLTGQPPLDDDLLDDGFLSDEVEPLLAEAPAEPGHSRRLISASLSLLTRSLLLWVCALALVTLLGA